MPAFGKRSESNLITCCSHLQRLARVVVVKFDCSVLWGRRGKEPQDLAFKNGWTTKPWPESIHNAEAPKLSKAMDLEPYPINFKDKQREYYFSGYVRGKAEELELRLRYGSDWDGDFDINDQVLRDPCHFECAEESCQEIEPQDEQLDGGKKDVNRTSV